MARISIVIVLATIGVFAASAAEPASHIAPAGGEVVNDAGLAWRVAVPEGWSWMPSTDLAPMMLVSPGGSVPSKSGEVNCTASSVAAVDADKAMNQDQLNARTRKTWEDTVVMMKKGASEDALGASLTDVADIKGVTRSVIVGPGNDDKKIVIMHGLATFATPEGGAEVNCSGPFDRADGALAERPVLKAMGDILKSLEPL